MRAVLYTEDMEPITIIDLPIEVHRFKFDRYKVSVIGELPPYQEIVGHMPINPAPKVVTVRVDKLRKDGKNHPMFFISDMDIVNALMLDSERLPGQERDWQRRCKEGFIDGLIAALSR